MRCSVSIALAALLIAGCGSSKHHAALSLSCTDPAALKTAALNEATLPDHTRISECVADTRSDADVQNVATALIAAADDLTDATPADPMAADGLGFLIGATQRTARGVSGQLGARMDAERRRVHETAPQRDAAVTAAMATGSRRG